ncbi:MAG: PD-(D/E)XK nuclease family protein [Gammaproteobacteria bacterium]|nr:PD-(D/E)XK nuclease family protein [Gammaproteobacteria bacterium]
MARNLAREAAAAMVAEGRSAWQPPRILPFSAWLSQLRDDYFLAADDARVPIDTQQALALWQSLIDRDVFIGEPRVAELAVRAWRLIHEHDLDRPERWAAVLLSEDSGRFKDWAARYRSMCARRDLVDDWAFAAEIPDLVGSGRIAAPDALELAGFELPMTPLQQRIVDAMAKAGTVIHYRETPQQTPAEPAITAFVEPDDEIRAAARWARQRLEGDPGQRLAVVVPDLAGRVGRVERIFRQVFDPPAATLRQSAHEPWHISLGQPLAEWPLTADALAILHLDERRVTQPQARRLLRSPFLPGFVQQGPAQDQALARLTREAPFDVSINELQWVLNHDNASHLAGRLDAWQILRRENAGHAWPSEWAARLQRELTCLEFGHGRSLDSREYQVLQRWHDLLEAFSTLDVVVSEPMPRPRALDLLNERAAAAVFREQNPGVPVEVLGVEEALGSRFDAVWITTLDGDTWPGPARRDPLIPAPVQARVPRATSDGCLAQARLELDGLLTTAPEVRGSFARGSDETALELTALLDGCRLTDAVTEPSGAPAELEVLPADAQAPPLTAGAVKGGTGVLRHQSACPFRAFAETRLAARELTPPRPGLDAGQRGTVVHRALEAFWNGLPDKAALQSLDRQGLQARIHSAVETALAKVTERYRLLLTDNGRALEERRTRRVLERWLELELARDDFGVAEHERPVTLAFAGLTLSGKIDRVDKLPDGRHMLIDYKTGRTGKGDWFPEPRLADPQLPAYAVAAEQPPAAIAFARIRPENLTFDGLADGDAGTPGVTDLAAATHKYKELDSWPGLLAAWRTHLETLAGDFRAGHAAVDPRHPSVCRYCHLHALCRIRERSPYDSLADDDGSGEHGDE